MIQISAIRNVSYHEVVSGAVEPANTDVQLWVLANDGRYYPQRPPVVEGHNFSTQCSFGFAAGPVGRTYQVVATLGKSLPNIPRKALPETLEKSDPAIVTRVS